MCILSCSVKKVGGASDKEECFEILSSTSEPLLIFSLDSRQQKVVVRFRGGKNFSRLLSTKVTTVNVP